MKNFLYIFIVILCGFVSCKKDDFSQKSPAERNLESIVSLKNELTQAPFGWKVIYFPKTDSLLFTNKDEVLEKTPLFNERYGYGGHLFLMKFNENGSVKMLSDTNQESAVTEKESLFEIRQNTFTQLSFTTFNYIHNLVNEHYSGSSDFLFVGKDFQENLIFRTASHIEYAREYIIFEKLKSDDDWLSQTQKSVVQKSLENRQFFQQMKNPQISIKKGSRVFFQSDVIIRVPNPIPQYKKILDEHLYKRYYLFRFTKKPNIDPNSRSPRESTGLGSGYVGTEYGLTFRTGIRYDKKNIFYDFQRVDDKFVCELVKIFDPILGKEILVSKHLFPQGEPTYFVAEIWDEGN